MGDLVIALLAVAVGVGLLALLVVVLVGPPLRRLTRQRTALSVAITQRTDALRAAAAERRTRSG